MTQPEQSFEERVRRRAYELWEEAGWPVGRADDDWRQARAELEGNSAERGENPPSEKEKKPMRNQSNGGRLRQSHPERLLALAADIRLAAEVNKRAAQEALAAAIQMGTKLIEAKALLRRGAWFPWLSEHAQLSEREAWARMRLARSRQRVSPTVTRTGVRTPLCSLRRRPSQ